MTHRKWSEAALVQGLCREDGPITDYYYHFLLREAKRQFAVTSWQQTVLEDCLADAFLTLQRKLRAGQLQVGKLDAYALSIIRLTFRDACRRERSRYLEDGRREALQLRLYDTGTVSTDVSTLFEKYDYAAHVDWLDGLSERDRKLLDLRLRGYAQKDCAQMLGLAHGSVRNIYLRLFREARALVG